ncbi:cation:proton antiporter [Vagococcus intermedius]|uniref:Cation:proton antiporter n=1 Tax=Vagococcus intermedius TaxID=2991418 RepID=A0AAF0CUJ2_9ENTE|nr:cation:proton antiporter [Vagococcus intermedius]WEG72982.1 cation:proton antiporter [Vagococcus intermedius]WEG75068.1 cation:proton antiporter [Vagococcus intermedius]
MLEELLIALIAILIGTKLAGHLCNLIGIPAVIGELLVGIILGPAMLSIVQPTDLIHMFSQIGVILLMFLAGLESDLGLLKKYMKPSVSVAVTGIIFPLILCAIVGSLFNLSWLSSLFLGIVFSATSVSISVQVLRDYRRLDSEEGSIILGAAVVDDIVVVLLVSIFATFINMEGDFALNGAFFWDLLGKKLLFFGLTYVFAKYMVKPLLKWTKRIVATEGETSIALVLCFTFAVLSEVLGMSDVIGAFFMGLILSNHSSKERIENKVVTIGYALFIPVFFVSIGLDIRFSAFKEHAMFIVLLSLAAVISKLVGGYISARASHINKNNAWLVGAGMVSRGEMALIIVQMGKSLDLVTGSIYSAIVVAIIIATLVSPLLIKFFIERGDKELAVKG